MCEFIFTLPGVKYFFSERLTQDPLEAFFGKHRARGGRSDNPTVKQFLENTVSLRVQGSAALDPIRGNCRKKRRLCQENLIDDTPLHSRQPLERKTGTNHTHNAHAHQPRPLSKWKVGQSAHTDDKAVYIERARVTKRVLRVLQCIYKLWT